MSDDKTNHGGGDRARVAGEEGCEVHYFADKHGDNRQARDRTAEGLK